MAIRELIADGMESTNHIAKSTINAAGFRHTLMATFLGAFTIKVRFNLSLLPVPLQQEQKQQG